MANVKISALPSYTGTAADLRWFVMNNSGETETYKYSGYSSPFLSTGTTNKVIQPVDDKALLQIGSGNTFNDYSGSNLKNAVVIGNRNKVDGAPNTSVMFIGNDMDSQQFGSYALHIGNGHYASGSYNISVGDSGIEMNGNYGLIIGSAGGSQAHKSWGNYNFNLGQSNQTQGITGAYTFGKNHTISAGEWGGIFGGSDNNISSSGGYGGIVGGQNNTLDGAGYGFIGGGKYNILSGGTNYSSIVGGLNNQNYGNYSGIFNGTLNTINNPATEHSTIIGSYSSTTEGDYSHIIGGLYNQIFNQQAVIVGGQSNIIAAGSSQAEIIGSRNCIITGTTTDNTIINSIDSVIPNGIDRVVMLGTSGKTANASDTTYVENIRGFGQANIGENNTLGGSYSSIVGGGNNTINGGSYNGIFGGQNNTNSSSRGVILGGFGNTNTAYAGGTILAGNNHQLGGAYSIIAGNNNIITGENCVGFGDQVQIGGNYNAITSGSGSRIIGAGNYNFIGAGNTNYITTSFYSSILNGNNNSITSLNYVVMLGTSARTATASATTYVENLHTYRTPSTEVQPISSGTTFTCNLDGGAKSQFYITGTSTINITNVRDGASFMIKTQTDGNYVMTWTATGYTFVFEGGIKDPGNNVTDIFVFEVFGSVIYGSRRHNFS